MTINQSGGSDQCKRVESTAGSQNYEEHHDGRKRRKVSYQGRTWGESEEELPVQPTSAPLEERTKIPHVYADQVILEKAHKLYETFTTIEDKVAGLFFYETVAYYDMQCQKEVERVIDTWRVGGLLFTKGDYKRQLYLVEHYQKLTQIPFLVGNDFVHSLSYYFQDDSPQEWGIDKIDVKYFSDLGRAAVFQNRRLGVHFQLTEKRNGGAFFTHFPLSEAHLKAFRKGIRDAHGIIGLFGDENKKFTSLSLERSNLSSLFSKDSLGGEINEVFSLKAITFFDLTSCSMEEAKERLGAAFQHNFYDAFLCSLLQSELIDFVVQCIKEGRIQEKDIEKRLTKVLALKVCCIR